jgi:hypothetical protein
MGPPLDGLPTAVDNSTLQYLPPIGNQGGQGSCTCFAACYYYNTYTQAMDEGYDVSGGDADHICSPAFMYPLVNGGVDGGASTQYVVAMLNDVGCSSWTLKPYNDSDWTSWPSEPAWVDALRNRTRTAHSIGGSTESGLDAIKQHLANGNVAATRFTVYNTWYWYYPSDQTGINNGVYYAPDGGVAGGHAVTLVGYDDSKSYVDHRDGQTHNGAFLLANSWGTSWGVKNSTGAGTNGFFWVAYTMFLESTFGPQAYYNDDRDDYQPSLYAVVGVNHAKRGKVSLRSGINASPAWYSYYAINQFGGDIYAVTDANRIAVDMSDGIPYIPTNQATVASAQVYVWPGAGSSGTITSAEFHEDFDGDGSYAVHYSSDPTITVSQATWGYAYATTHSFSITTSTPDPSTVPSGGSAGLGANYADDQGHGVASWSWADGAAGGSFFPSANVQNPSYTAPANRSDSDATVTLTLTATCDGPVPLTDSDSTSLTVQPVEHSFVVVANPPSPATVSSGGAATLSATPSDSRLHGAVNWSWTDNGAGGSFSPSATVQSPTYDAPANTTDNDLIVTLSVSATCDGPVPLSDDDSTTLTVQPVAHSLEVYASADPTAVESGGTSSLTANANDSRSGHSITAWEWDDGAAGGSFDSSASVQNPSYTAPANVTGADMLVTLTVNATCDGPVPLQDSDSVELTVESAAPWGQSIPEVLLEVHPNERAPGSSTGQSIGGEPWTRPGPPQFPMYWWKHYRFVGSDALWIQVCAQNWNAIQNGTGDDDNIRMRIDGFVPVDYDLIQNGPWGAYQWRGSKENGHRWTLRFLYLGLSPIPVLHALQFEADETPVIWWVKVTDLEPGAIEAF